uniref:Complement factor H-like n=1 Tax=Rhabditophanes sp. KR3021 TaxID=114890 RepID=A0AC35U964_9BILA
MSCINPNATCTNLADPENGHLLLTNKNSFNSIAEYFCNQGYILTGPGRRRCQANKKWSSSSPSCRLQYKCGPPPELPNTTNNGTSFNGQYDVSQKVHYQCSHGYSSINKYILKTPESMPYYISICQLNKNHLAQWIGPDIKCRARSCGDPSVPLNGYREGDLFHYPHEVKFFCYPGFHLIGSSRRKCEANEEWTVGQVQRFCTEEGSWTGLEPPVCEEIKCPPLPPLFNGYMEGYDTSYGTTVIFRCFEGMKIIGSPFTKCQEKNSWSHSVPLCLNSCKVPRISNGFVLNSLPDKLAQHGISLKINCNNKHEPNGPTAITCTNGTFTPIPPKCIPNKCKSWPPRISHTNVLFTKTNHGSIAKYQCRQGFQPSVKNNIISCLYGEWVMAKPRFRCIPLSCNHPVKTFGNLDGGHIMLEGQMGSYDFANYISKSCTLPPRLHAFFLVSDKEGKIIESNAVINDGVKSQLVCLKGYQVVGNEVSTCHSGHLMETLGNCKPMICKLSDHQVKNIIWMGSGSEIKHTESIHYGCGNGGANIKATCFHGNLIPKPFCEQTEFVPRNYCPAPASKAEASVYVMNGTEKEILIHSESFYKNGTVFHFYCSSSSTFEKEAGVIECIESEWITRLIPCIENVIKSALLSNSNFNSRQICSPPILDYDTFRVYNINSGISAKQRFSNLTIFPHGTILMVTCAMYDYVSNYKYQTSEIKCKKGRWKRPKDMIKCPDIKDTCLYEMDSRANLSVYHVQGERPVLFNERFIYLDKLQFTCVNNYLSQLRGTNEVTCLRGKWSAPYPRCVLLDPAAIADNASPPVYFTVHGYFLPNHHISPKGELYVKQGSTLNLYCLHKMTNNEEMIPIWKYESSFRTYPVRSDANYSGKPQNISAFALTIHNTLPQDSGLYHCTIPFSGATTSIKVVVTDDTCPPLKATSRHLLIHLSHKESFLGTMAQFSCPANYMLSGARALYCTTRRKWSHKTPTCVQQICEPLALKLNTNLKVSITSYKYGGIASFVCDGGYELIGRSTIHCQLNGTWSSRGEMPVCVVRECSTSVSVPGNGFIQRQYVRPMAEDGETSTSLIPYLNESEHSTRYHPGHLLIFSCNPNYMLTGNDFILCQRNGQWTNLQSKCEPFCRFPGIQPNTKTTSPPREYYKASARIVYVCQNSTNFKLSSHNVLECLQNGQWSRKIPQCINMTTN